MNASSDGMDQFIIRKIQFVVLATSVSEGVRRSTLLALFLFTNVVSFKIRWHALSHFGAKGCGLHISYESIKNLLT